MSVIKKTIATITIMTLVFTFAFASLIAVSEAGNAYAATNLSKPTISLRVSGNKITVNWEKVPKAKKYQVAYKIPNVTDWTYRTTKKLTFTIKGKYNKNYRIKVRAIRGTIKGKWSRTAKRRTDKAQAPVKNVYDLSKPSKLKKYASFKIGRYYRLKDPMGTGRIRKVKISYGDIMNVSGNGVTVMITGVTKQGFDYRATVNNLVSAIIGIYIKI